MGSDDLVRVGSYLSVLVVMATWELLAPRRKQTASKLCRWSNGLASPWPRKPGSRYRRPP